MKKIYPILILIALFLISGCKNSSKNEENLKSITIKTTALNTTQEWQPNPVIKNYSEAKQYCQNLILNNKDDWRLPTPKEFFALLENNRSIDSYFPQNSKIKEFYTDTPTQFDKDQIWKVSTWSNTLSYTHKDNKLGVRCVRGEKLPSHTFKKENDTIKDTDQKKLKTLIWQDNKDNGSKQLSWNQAKQYCSKKGFRLPTISELLELHDVNFTYNANDNFIPFWSATPLPTSKFEYLTINYQKGISFDKKSTKNYIRCVKDFNHPPTANPLVLSTNEDTNLTITLSGSDSDNDILSYYIESNPKYGTLSGNAPNLIYTPNKNYNGNDSFSFKIYDGKVYSNIATVTIKINPVANKPIIKPLKIDTVENGSIISGKLSVVNIDNLTLRYILKSNIEGFTLDSSGNFTFNPSNKTYETLNKDEKITKTATIRVEDSLDSSLYDEKNISITIRGKNDLPIALNDYIIKNQNQKNITIRPLVNDKDVDQNHTLSISSISTNITNIFDLNIYHNQDEVIIEDLAAFRYLNQDQNTTINISYTIKDEHNTSSNANIFLTIKGLNDAPIANATVDGNFTFNSPLTFDASLSYDLDANSTLTYKWLYKGKILSNNISFTKNNFLIGDHVVTLVVTDEHNLNSTYDINFTITNPYIIQLPKTGQTSIYYTYDDGFYQKGADSNFTKYQDIVIDNNLGLIWQDNIDITNGIKTWPEANATCANLTLYNKNDWRLPTVHELFFLVKKGDSYSSIDDAFYYNISEYFWTSAINNTLEAIYIDFEDMNMDKEGKYNKKYVRCVRSNNQFTKNMVRDDTLEVVYDYTLNLMWNDNYEANSTIKNWQDAIDYCENATFANNNDWRLPNIHELYSIAIPFQSPNAFDKIFVHTTNQQYWSSTHFANYYTETNISQAYNVDFSDGLEYEDFINQALHVRCVRDIVIPQ